MWTVFLTLERPIKNEWENKIFPAFEVWRAQEHLNQSGFARCLNRQLTALPLQQKTTEIETPLPHPTTSGSPTVSNTTHPDLSCNEPTRKNHIYKRPSAKRVTEQISNETERL